MATQLSSTFLLGRPSLPSLAFHSTFKLSHPRPIFASAQDSQPPPPPDDPDFDERLSKIQRKVTSGSGKKADKRRARKSGDPSFAQSSSGKPGVFLPPVPLKNPISDGLTVELGFNSYTERLNGNFASLGLAAVLLVELATGGSFLKYHGRGVLGIQAYFMLAMSALYIKFEKEKISIWPKS